MVTNITNASFILVVVVQGSKIYGLTRISMEKCDSCKMIIYGYLIVLKYLYLVGFKQSIGSLKWCLSTLDRIFNFAKSPHN